MARVRASQPIDMLNVDFYYGYVSIATPNHIQITNSGDSSKKTNYYGYDFTIGEEGLTSGEVVTITVVDPRTISGEYIRDVYTLEYFSAPATTVQSFLNFGDVEGLQQYLLAGNDTLEGSVYDDRLIGWSGDDELFGANGNDTLYGSSGNDWLNGSYGDDFLIGGAGRDYAIFGGPDSQFIRQMTSDGWLAVQDSVTSAFSFGTSYLKEVERLRFSDVDVALDIYGVAGEAYRLYKAAFDRIPDLDGLGFWIHSLDSGQSITDAANGFINSAEFQQDYGTNPSDRDFVQLLYENVLDRQPDGPGYAYWVTAMQEGMSRAEVLLEFSNSPENIRNVEPLVSSGIRYLPYQPFRASPEGSLPDDLIVAPASSDSDHIGTSSPVSAGFLGVG